MKRSPTIYVSRLRTRFLATRWGETLLWVAGAMLVVYSLVKIFIGTPLLILLTTAFAGIIILILKVQQRNLFSVDDSRVIQFLNNRYPVLEDSADLLIKNENEINTLEQIQQHRIRERFDGIYPSIKVPHHLFQSAVIFAGCLGFFFALSSFDQTFQKKLNRAPSSAETLKEKEVKLPAGVKDIQIRITPPGYTKLPGYTSRNPQIEIVEGSAVRWDIVWTDSIDSAFIVFAGDTAKLDNTNSYSRTFSTSTFYQLAWQTGSSIKRSTDYYRIQVTPDKPPLVSVPNIQQFTEYTNNDKLSFEVHANITDDFGLTDAFIIGTVSKGSGESVKFREVKLPFDRPGFFSGKNIRASTEIDLTKMGLEPGDELYFYVEAFDNKQPRRNRSRTETYFVLLQDTASNELSIEGGLGVDLMPEYFRSQRQIIIDSEKLLRERKVITKQEFNSRSNELGYDQKVLRLKYGEFLGEEFESGIGPASAIPQEEEHNEEEEEDVTKQYGHQHDTENEHNLVPEKKNEAHQHNAGQEGEEDQENPMAEFLHSHDNAEEATFFAQSIRAKLKAALSVMWDAELHLRLFDPDKSLPYQYQALKLLKEISNDSRIYVHKTGFDPPPLKEEKRLSGDLSEIKDSRLNAFAEKEIPYPAIAKALLITESLLLQKTITAEQKTILNQAGNELSALALKEPGRYLDAMSVIRALIEDGLKDDARTSAIHLLRNNLWQAVPKHMIAPHTSLQQRSRLDSAFIQNLENLKHE